MSADCLTLADVVDQVERLGGDLDCVIFKTPFGWVLPPACEVVRDAAAGLVVVELHGDEDGGDDD